jgi:hypothetical protein
LTREAWLADLWLEGQTWRGPKFCSNLSPGPQQGMKDPMLSSCLSFNTSTLCSSGALRTSHIQPMHPLHGAVFPQPHSILSQSHFEDLTPTQPEVPRLDTKISPFRKQSGPKLSKKPGECFCSILSFAIRAHSTMLSPPSYLPCPSDLDLSQTLPRSWGDLTPLSGQTAQS